MHKPYLHIKFQREERERERAEEELCQLLQWPQQQLVGCLLLFQFAAPIQPQDAVLEPKRTPTRYPRMYFHLYVIVLSFKRVRCLGSYLYLEFSLVLCLVAK